MSGSSATHHLQRLQREPQLDDGGGVVQRKSGERLGDRPKGDRRVMREADRDGSLGPTAP
jgi:hypothetical protein